MDNNNIEHYKCINIEPSLEDKNYEVFGSIIYDDSILEDFHIDFGLYDLNGFFAIINKLKDTNIDIKKCCILWIIVGSPLRLSIFSPKNRDFQVKFFKETIKLQPDKNCHNIKTPFPLYQEDIISFNTHTLLANYKFKCIYRLVNWSDNNIYIEIIKSNTNFNNNSNGTSDNDSDGNSGSDPNTKLNIKQIQTERKKVNKRKGNEIVSIDLNICILSSYYKYLKIDNIIKEYPLNLIGDILNSTSKLFLYFLTSLLHT